MSKYKIKLPRKCRTCDKADVCELLNDFDEVLYGATRVLLDCKAFYLVFCELEERCCIPFGDQEKMKQYDEESDAGKRPFLTPAMVTNGVLAAELALKALTLKETGTFDCVHNLSKLFYALPDIHKKALTSMIKENSHQNDSSLRTYLETIKDFFVEWRYFFEKDTIAYTNFLLEFIHIVCDYAIEVIESTVNGENGYKM